MPMNVDRVRPALVVLLGVLAVSAAAASMDGSARDVAAGAGGPNEGGQGDGDGAGVGAGESTDVGLGDLPAWALAGWVVENMAVVVLGFGTLFVLAYTAYRWWRDGLDGLARMAQLFTETTAGAVLAALLWAVMLALVWLVRNDTPVSLPAEGPAGGTGTTDPGTATSVGTSLPSILLVLVVPVVLLLAAVLLASQLLGSDEEGGATTVEAVDHDGDESSAAATRVPAAEPDFEDAPASNAVYRAWNEMARSVDRSGLSTATPAEVARRAIDEGRDPGAVRTLTDVFEEVRYGGRPPTEDRESRARSALERLDGGGDRA